MNKLPQFIDPRKLAQKNVSLSGIIEPGALKRLAEAVIAVNNPVEVELNFDLDGNQRVVVQGSVAVGVELVCQRCLGNVAIALKSGLSLIAVSDDEAAKRLTHDFGPWLIDPGADSGSREGADLYQAIEDELLLALPIVAYHEYACVDQALYSAVDGADESVDEERASPFAALKKLQQSPKD